MRGQLWGTHVAGCWRAAAATAAAAAAAAAAGWSAVGSSLHPSGPRTAAGRLPAVPHPFPTPQPWGGGGGVESRCRKGRGEVLSRGK